jgi:DegV family protein with EDD domain
MVRIIADTLSCIPVNEAKTLGIPYVPQIIVFGEDSYRDDTDINSRTFLDRLRISSELPKTAAPPPALYNPIFENIINSNDTAIVICPSAELSGTFRSAQVSAGDFPSADIRIINTQTLASSLGAIVLESNQMAQEGSSAEDIIDRIEYLSIRARTYFLVDTLEYLHKGGRIGGAKALLGSILQLKPILTLENGRIESLESQRTYKRALARLKELVFDEVTKSGDAKVAVLQGDAEEEADLLAREIELELGQDKVNVYDLPPAILVHSGPGALGVSFFVD